MLNQWEQVAFLWYGYGEPPVILAGDVFDKWNSPAELITYVLNLLGRMNVYAVPGQHDLPNHHYPDMHRSAYGAIVASGKMKTLQLGSPVEIEGAHPIRLHGFPYGFKIQPCTKPHDMMLEIAVIHKYVWKKGTEYVGAPEGNKVGSYSNGLAGYDIAIFGDNHTPFTYQFRSHRCLLYNCGTFMRRRLDERGIRPSVGLIKADGTAERHYLDVSADKFLEVENGKVLELMEGIGFQTFVEELGALGNTALNFSDTIHKLLERERVSKSVKNFVLTWLEGAEK